jgi:hypothetical protein
MIRRAQPDEFHFIPVKQREVADPGSILFLFMTQSDNPAFFRHQAPHRFTRGGARGYMFAISTPSKNSQHLNIKNIIVRIIEFPSAEVFSCGLHDLSFPAGHFGIKTDVVLTEPAISMVDRTAICFWLKAEANLLRQAPAHYYEKNYPIIAIMNHLRQTKIGETHYFSHTKTVEYSRFNSRDLIIEKTGRKMLPVRSAHLL